MDSPQRIKGRGMVKCQHLGVCQCQLLEIPAFMSSCHLGRLNSCSEESRLRGLLSAPFTFVPVRWAEGVQDGSWETCPHPGSHGVPPRKVVSLELL